ncbi:hypothetical protein COW80_00375 [Candidatus Beckwithbacteria bacterium CG22_combo_CG10-13_8_21_14_all_01_47_9]|uniref:Penicillin-binding protein 2 n=5 Tax=Candidatus Beckwithiibacteriota TaxID=1752726 RepID=A0A2H0E1Z8_9BACT|nr:MAG: hypothetical protein AUJ59_03585 [Candidatus Beckwithbacteria bacterium CG1_02_47_37]PIP52241.1 MAG: hypothetical protein COX09_02645 [Candidatus Beckwithbacteria bacterium CG23_combo_of_CG06-09_8_20_14_all_47_9]PIP88427.1 MAG: hypothetical protein COW80_00375 [Candidatus Beckwithbacteria bacterium CG22_combo_CG10-13_8_21_14_all_01_47_9]PJA23273.1 MAG: hypothetical protein COX59_00750 [Candidatus Beckwithbacteria bacterium CG_4_10_14_0_2_um_filter_47_25]PJC66613.1 MAG: hypothetical prot
MRWLIFDWLVTLSLFGLLARLIGVGLINHDYYQTLARENRVKVIKLPAERGKIYDRFNQSLTGAGEAFGHVLGYVGEGNREIIGKDGLELVYDQLLRGKDGSLLVETDAEGLVVREIGRNDPQPGADLTTTLDKGLQQKAFALLAGRKGALVASEPQTGAILALVSSPGFKPDAVGQYLTDKNLPLFNRAIGGVYPPGSTFKIITAVAALEEKKIDQTTMIEDTGEIQIGPYRYGNWYFSQYGRTEGWLNLVGAIKRSNDIFFYRLGESLGIRALSEWAKWFGVGNKTMIDLPGEAAGVMPDPDWKQMVKKEDWFLGDTLISAIGQGDILMTPLQVNQMAGLIAAQGNFCRPYLVGNKNCRQLDISPSTLALIIEGMSQVTQTGGTAFPFFDFPIPVAGKTGTAEFGLPAQAGDQAKTHAWFTGFAPADNPNIVVTVLLEGAGEGSYQAAPVAKELLIYWFSRQ